MSSAPNVLAPAGKLPTGDVVTQPSSPSYSVGQSRPSTRRPNATHSRPQALTRRASGGWSPPGYNRLSLPRPAYSHSASAGTRRPRDWQYATAWFQSTQLTG